MAYIEKEAALVTKIGTDQVLILPYTNITNVEGGVASINGVLPDTSGAVTIPVATPTIAGTVLLYSNAGNNTDGTMTQASITAALNGKLASDGTAAKANADASGNVISSTYATKEELSTTAESAIEVAQEYADAKISENAYTLPEATSNALGGVKVGSNISAANGVISVADASTTVKGVVQLSSDIDNASTTVAATASAVKTAYDLAAGKQNPATTIAGYGITDAYTKTEVDAKVAGLVDSAPEALNTLNELAAALGDDPNFATTLATQIGTKANSADLAKVATSGSYKDLLDQPSIPTIPTSLPADGGNADTVNGFSVNTNVPADAKFTDTVYTHPEHSAQANGLYKITVDKLGHVSAVSAVAKSDITALGIPAQDTTYTLASFGISATAEEINYVDGVTSKIQTQLDNKAAAEHTHLYAGSSSVGGAATSANKLTTNAGSATTPVYFKDGVPVECTSLSLEVTGVAESATKDGNGNVIVNTYETKENAIVDLSVDGNIIVFTKGNGVTNSITTQDTDTTYDVATSTVDGLLSADDKVKLDGIETGANAYSHPEYTAKASGLYKVTIDALGHVSSTSGVTKDDITSLGIPAQDTVYTLPNATTTVLGGVKVGTNIAVSNGTISVANGSTSTKGVLQLTDSTSSTSTTTAATPAAVKSAYDLANSKQSPATTLSGYGITDAYTKTEVDTKVAGLVDSAPEALNTLNELAAALGDDPNFATTIATQIGTKANSADLAAVATSGSYTDLSNKPTIPTSLPANGGAADSADKDSDGNIITDTYETKANAITGLSVSGKVITYTKGDGGTGTITTQDTNTTYTNASLGQGYGTCTTAAATTAKVVTLSSYALTTGGVVSVKFSGAVPAGATMNINSKGAKAIFYKGKAIVAGVINAGEVGTFIYDGTQYHLIAVDRARLTPSLVPFGTQINPSSTNLIDLNTIEYLKVGNYYSSNTANTEYISNKPQKTAFMMEVTAPLSQTIDDEETTTYCYRLRKFVGYQGDVWYQLCRTSGTAGVWTYGSWIKQLDANDTAYAATRDGSGNTITSTYETKANAITGLSVSGQTITYTKGNGTTGTLTTQDTNTTYSAATTSAAGLMSASDKTKLDGIATGANAYTHPSYTAKSSGLYKVTVDATGHVSAATAVTKSDITGLGIPAQDTTYTLPTASSSTLGGVTTTSTVTSNSGYTACPIISGVPYYKDTNTTYSLSSFGITATATELNALDGITATVTELNYCDGVTSNIQTQLNGKLSTTGKAASATVADSANAVAWSNVTDKPSIPAVTKVTFTASDSRWGSASNGKYPLTIAASGGEFLNCYRTNGSVYDKTDVSVTVSGTDIIIYSLDKFAGYMTYIN